MGSVALFCAYPNSQDDRKAIAVMERRWESAARFPLRCKKEELIRIICLEGSTKKRNLNGGKGESV